MSLLRAGVPVQPDAAQARRWLTEELSRPEYREARGSWLQRAWEWLVDRLDGARWPVQGTDWVTLLVVVLLVAGVAAGVLAASGPVRRRARATVVEAVFESGPEPSSAHLRRAEEAARAGDHARAVVERFRGLVRALEERALLDARPGRTAHEAAVEAGRALPERAEDLVRAAATFDDVRYGGRAATAATDEGLRDVVERTAGTRPRQLAGSTGSTGSAG